jgi:large subunit ribosomal protein L15
MDLSKIKVRFKNKKIKRVGRGVGSGRGKTSGRGNKGAGSREGQVLPYIGFRGGNMPLARLLPKRGFHSPVAKEFQVVNLKDIALRLKDAPEINPVVLRQVNLIKNDKKPVKILASIKDAFNLKAVFKADSFSEKAKKIIEGAGGKADCLKR